MGSPWQGLGGMGRGEQVWAGTGRGGQGHVKAAGGREVSCRHCLSCVHPSVYCRGPRRTTLALVRWRLRPCQGQLGSVAETQELPGAGCGVGRAGSVAEAQVVPGAGCRARRAGLWVVPGPIASVGPARPPGGLPCDHHGVHPSFSQGA